MRTTIITYCFLMLCSAMAFANNNGTETKKKYRVVAVKKGDEKITSISNTVDVSKKVYVYIPNAFTPDGDGINDLFGAKGEGIKEYRLLIYDRWGEQVFKSESIDHQWDGTYNNNNAPEGSYVYELYVQNEEGNDFKKQTGSVTLLR